MRVIVFLFLFLFFYSRAFCHGVLIEVCGIDGSGKSTFIQDLKEFLLKKGEKVLVVRPLSGDPAIYQFLDRLEEMKSKSKNFELKTRIDQFKTDYFFLGMLNYESLIKDYLSQGYYIICDRYLFSYKTYQESFQQEITNDLDLLIEMPAPNMIFLLTAPVEIALNRIRAKGPAAFYENERFLSRAQEIFCRDANKYPKLIKLEGNGDRESNVLKAISHLEGL